MLYKNTVEGRFVSRPNRFIAHVDINGKVEVCHVKNTGRCRELLTEGARVILEPSDSPTRKTGYDLVAVYKNGNLINIDSQAPNKAVLEWLREGGLFGEPSLIKPEATYGSSRFDFYVETEGRRIFAEVKGVTLEVDGVLMFPDAPTERGVKHIKELCRAVEEGYEAYVIFVIQTERCKYFTPNRETHPRFADALREAEAKGVHILALTCKVTPDSMVIDTSVSVVI